METDLALGRVCSHGSLPSFWKGELAEGTQVAWTCPRGARGSWDTLAPHSSSCLRAAFPV